jgi:hypothetical protein
VLWIIKNSENRTKFFAMFSFIWHSKCFSIHILIWKSNRTCHPTLICNDDGFEQTRTDKNNDCVGWLTTLHSGCTDLINPSAWRFKFRCRVSPAVLFSARHLNSDQELLYSSLFLKYMRYKHETFTKVILKDCFRSFIIWVPCISAIEAGGLEVEKCMVRFETSF